MVVSVAVAVFGGVELVGEVLEWHPHKRDIEIISRQDIFFIHFCYYRKINAILDMDYLSLSVTNSISCPKATL